MSVKFSLRSFTLFLKVSVSVHTFLYEHDICFVPPPCTCQLRPENEVYIRCKSNQIETFPDFSKVVISLNDHQLSSVTLSLENNSLNSIPENAFAKFATAPRLTIKLQQNNISIIDKNAFNGAQNTTFLDMSNNSLRSINESFRKLTKLRILNVMYNPIQTLNDKTLHNIGTSLTDLTASFTSWPYQLHLLRKLDSLRIDKMSLTTIPLNAFHGFDSTLTNLWIQNSKLINIPSAVCHLRRLLTLHFSSNHNFNTYSDIMVPCHPPQTALSRLYLEDNDLTSFPSSIFTAFPNVEVVFVNYNQKLRYIVDSEIPLNRALHSLSLGSNGFRRVPSAVRKFPNLQSLYMRGNNIITLEGMDLYNMSKLEYLFLDRNPIQYISKDAFKTTPDLKYISLDQTSLTKIPEAIQHLKQLGVLNLRDNQIECTCDLTWMNVWTGKDGITIYGQCERSSERLHNYINETLPSCPPSIH